MSVNDFGRTAIKLSRNPLGILALFQVLIYGIAGYVAANLAHDTQQLTILTWFLVCFPVLVLAVFTYLVAAHHQKLYAPTDFADETNFMAAIEKGIRHSEEHS